MTTKTNNKLNNRKNKNNKHYPKSDGGSKRNMDSSDRGSTNRTHISGDVNDVSYYFSNQLLKDQITNISFNNFTGVQIPITYETQVPSSEYLTPSYAMRIALNPSAGFTQPDFDVNAESINLAALQTYTMLSANNAKTTSYAPQDITMLLLSMGSIISLSSHITRAFGTAYVYNQRNRAYPRNIMNVLGVDYDDLIENFANYRVRFNTLMTAVSKIPIPANIAYFQKCRDIYAGIYLDMAGSPMAQTYVFAPESIWFIDEELSDSGSVLVPYEVLGETQASRTMNELLTILETCINAVLQSSTFNYIFADILRISSKEGMPLYAFTSIPEDYVVLPMYNPEVRTYINNLTIMGHPLTEGYDEGMTQGNRVLSDPDNNRITYRPQFKTTAWGRYANTSTKLINFDKENVTSDDILMATRMLSTARWNFSEQFSKTADVALPDHYVTYIKVFSAGSSPITLNEHCILVDEAAKWLSLQNFDWHPMLPIVKANSDVILNGVLGDLNYYTTVSHTYNKPLQDATYFGLFELR